MRTTLYLYSHTQQSAILPSSSFWHHTKIRRFTMVCRSPHLLVSVRCYKKAIEKNSCVFSGASMWKRAKKTSVKPVWCSDKRLEHFPHTNSACACRTPSCWSPSDSMVEDKWWLASSMPNPGGDRIKNQALLVRICRLVVFECHILTYSPLKKELFESVFSFFYF